MKNLARIALLLALLPVAAFAQTSNRGALYAPNNLSDLADPAQARTNLGLGALSVLSSLAGLDASATNITDPNGGNVATIASRAGEVLDAIGGFGATPQITGYTSGTISQGSGTFTDSHAGFPSGAVGDDMFVLGVGPNGAALDTTIGTVNSLTSVSFSGGATASYPSGNSYIRFADVATPGSGCVPGAVETLAGGTALLQGQLTVTSCGLLTPASVTIAAAGTGGTANAQNCVVADAGTGGVTPIGWGKYRLVVDINGSGGIGTVVSVLYPGAYTTNPSDTAADPVTSLSCGALTGATLNIAAALGVETTVPRVRGSYSVVPTTATASSNEGIIGDTYTLASGVAGAYAYGLDVSAELGAAITGANTIFAGTGAAQEIRLPHGNYFVDHSALPTMTSGVHIAGAGRWTTRVYFGPSYVGPEFSFSRINAGPDSSVGALPLMASGGVSLSNLAIINDPEYDSPVTTIDSVGRNDNTLISDITVLFGYGPCLYVGDASGGIAGGRESMIHNLECWSTGTPLLAAELFNAAGPGATSVINNWMIDTRQYDALGPGLQVVSSDSSKVNSYIHFSQLSVERAGQANPAAGGVYFGAPGDTGSTTRVYAGILQIINTSGAWACGLYLGGDSTTPTGYDDQIMSGSLTQVQNGICYGNVRNSEVNLTDISSVAGTAVVADPSMSNHNFLNLTSSIGTSVGMFNALPGNLAISDTTVMGNLADVRTVGKVYGPEYSGVLTSEPIAVASNGTFERLDSGSTSVVRTASIGIATADPGTWHWEACVYRDEGGQPSGLVADTGTVPGSTGTGVQTATFPTTLSGLTTPNVLPGPAAYWVELVTDATGPYLMSMVPNGASGIGMGPNQVGAASAASLFGGTAAAGRTATVSQTVGACPATAPSSTTTPAANIPYVALGF